MKELHKIMIVGASLGLLPKLSELFPSPKPVRPITERDTAALSAAEAKRQRRIQRNKAAAGEGIL